MAFGDNFCPQGFSKRRTDMATFVSKNGKIQVKIRKNGAVKSESFATKSEAKVWAG
jgi:hypothetical protein